MSKLRPQKFTLEDFQDQKDWIGNLFSPLNSLIQDIVIMFNNNLTISDNLYQEIKEITFKNDSGNYPIRFKTKYNTSPKSVMIIYAFDNTATSMNASQAYPVWSYKNGEVLISSISGLTSSNTITIRLHLIYG